MTENTTKYALYTICDNNFIETCLVMLFSFICNNKWFTGDIIVLHDGLSYTNSLRLKALGENIKVVSVNTDEYTPIMKGTEGITAKTLKKCFYKYELFKNQKYDTILWVDADIIFNGSIKNLMDSDFDFCWCEDKAFVGSGTYFNTGFFIFKNNDKVRDNTFFNDIYDFTVNIRERKFESKTIFNGLYADQDILNEKVKSYFHNIKIAPILEYNLPQQVDKWEIINNAKVIHYCGGDKPFSEKINKKYLSHLLWYYYFYQLNH